MVHQIAQVSNPWLPGPAFVASLVTKSLTLVQAGAGQGLGTSGSPQMPADDEWLGELLQEWIAEVEALRRRLDPDSRDRTYPAHEELRPYAAELQRRLMALDRTRLQGDPQLILRDAVYLAQAVNDARRASYGW